MGWSSATGLMADIIGGFKKKKIPSAERRKAYAVMIPAFENYDADTLDECRGLDPEFDVCLPKYEEDA